MTDKQNRQFVQQAVETGKGVMRLAPAWVPRAGNAAPQKPRIKLAEGLTVRNEFIECDVDVNTGGIRSFRDARTRATRFGQQLVFNPGSKMVARDIAITNNGGALGEITSTGDLIDERDEILATYKQRVRAWLGRPVLEMRIELDVKHQPTGYPWHSYYGARFGWRDDLGHRFCDGLRSHSLGYSFHWTRPAPGGTC